MFNLLGSISHQADSRCFYTSTFRPQSIFMPRSNHVTSPAPITWLWNLTPLWVIRPVGIYREGSVSVFHSSCVKWSSPGLSASRAGKLAWKGILQEWLTCLRAPQGAVIIVHVTWHLRPLRNASHLLKHAPLAACKIGEGGQFHRVMFCKVQIFFSDLHPSIVETWEFWPLSRRNTSLNSATLIYIIQDASLFISLHFLASAVRALICN